MNQAELFGEYDDIMDAWEKMESETANWQRNDAKSSAGAAPVGKTLLNAPLAAQRQLHPVEHPWAYEHYRQQSRNFWLPSEVPMSQDVADWKFLYDSEKQVLTKTLAQFAALETSVADNLAMCLYRHVCPVECRMFLAMQTAIEAVHQEAYSLMLENLDLNLEAAFTAWRNVPSVEAKHKWADAATREIASPMFSPNTLSEKRRFLMNVIAFMLLEGVGFMAGFAILCWQKHVANKMTGLAEQTMFIARDEALHCSFATHLAVQMCKEEPELWNADAAHQASIMGGDVLMMECEFARDAVGEGLPGLSYAELEGHLSSLAHRRLAPFHVPPMHAPPAKPLKWLAEQLETKSERNFFETTLSEYSRGGLDWEN